MIKRERGTIASLILLCKPAETDAGVMINRSTKVQHTELPKCWNIVKIYDSLISIHIADRQSHIITAETHKLYRMTNFFEGWRAIGHWKIQSDYRLWLITCIQVIHMCHWFCDKLPIASLICMYPCFFISLSLFAFKDSCF